MVVGVRDLVILECIAPPALAELDELRRKVRSAAQKVGMKPADVKRAGAKARVSER